MQNGVFRKDVERFELEYLHPKAAKSALTSGRERDEDPCPVRTAFQRDRDRVIYSKAFRRLKHKTQVFLSPTGDHYRTRLTHTLEVAQISRTIARALRLNEDLAEAIALGHDLGHTPFGHAGEEVLNRIVPGGFYHPKQSLRVVERIENEGKGLNLTYEVRQGILHHSKGMGSIMPSERQAHSITLEAQIVRLADAIAYVNHDLDDAIRAGLLGEGDIPPNLREELGDTHSGRINTMVTDVIRSSLECDLDRVRFSPGVLEAVTELRGFLYDRVYSAPVVYREFIKATKLVEELYNHLLSHPEHVNFTKGNEGDPLPRRVSDFIAGMTDRYALHLYSKLFLPSPWEF